MGTTLTGTTPQDTYDSLIKVTDNGPLSGSLKTLTDGLGNDSALALSTGAASITGTLAVSGNVTIDTTTLVVDAAGDRVIMGAAAALQGDSLEVHAKSNAGAISIFGRAADNGSAVSFRANGATTQKAQIYGSDAGLGFATGTTERVIIDTSGNVGIGTSSPDNVLDLGQNTAGRSLTWDNQINAIATYSSGDLMLANNFYGSTASDSFLTSTTATFGAAGIRLSATGGPSTGGFVSFFANAAAAKTAGTAFTPTEVCRVTPNGLTFNGDTAAANALDDYEEGTWTMGVSFGGASVGVTYTINTGTYTKIGRQVTVNGYLILTSKGSSTGSAKITGLPFTIGGDNPYYSTASLHLSVVSFTNQFQSYGIINTTTIALEEITILGVNSALTDADFANNSQIIVSLTYFV